MESRTKNTTRNIYSGILKQALNTILPFFVRTIILYRLGEQYQGLSSLFNSILHVLNLADLGFSTAVVYILYKPVAENDKNAVRAIIAYLQKIYRVVGISILGAGLVLLPFIPKLISGTYPEDINLYVLYLIYLINTVISYFCFAYKSALLNAVQRDDLVSKASMLTTSGVRILQIAALLVFPNYYVYVLLIPISTILNNLLLQMFSKRYFPEYYPEGNVSKDILKVFKKQLGGIVINRVGDVARNSFDSIIISMTLGLTMVAVYDNYYYIYNAIYGIALVLTHAMQASVGNSIVKESIDKNYKNLKTFTFIFTWFTGWCTICLCCLYQPFMYIWMGGNETMILSDFNMVLFCLYFYSITMNNTRNLYLNGNGLYWECRVWYICEAIGNLVLNFVLGYFLGVTGVILATIITIFVFNFIARTNILFKKYFKFSPKGFYFTHTLYFVVVMIAMVTTYALCSLVTIGGILGLMIRFMICAAVPNVVFLGISFKTAEFKTAFSYVKKLVTKI